MHDRAGGRDAGDVDSWPDARTLPVLGRAERLPDGIGAGGGSRAVIRVRVLGKLEIVDAPADLRVRKNAMELLTYLIVRGGSAHQEDIAADLMPEPSRRRAAERMHTYTYNLRQVFTRLGGDGSYLQLRRHRYVLDRAGFDVDLWTMLDAVADAGAAPEQQSQVAALRRAVDAYTGPFADGAGYSWLAGYRYLIRREYVDAVVALADNLAGPARAVLEEGQRHHPYAERLTAVLKGFTATR
jgi:two-component SAPR family response regulator